jgi:predicted methyltransferase
MNYDNAVSYVHNVLGSILHEGDVAVDATVGNGWDTALMADLVGESGVIYGFDIQQVALEVTRSRTSGSRATVRLHHQGHESLASAVDGVHHGSVRAVTFNLGYLPGGDKEITTHADTTVSGLEQARSVLSPDGVITIVCYRHAEGERELDTVRKHLSTWPQERYTVVEVDFINQKGTPPIVFVVSCS